MRQWKTELGRLLFHIVNPRGVWAGDGQALVVWLLGLRLGLVGGCSGGQG